MPSTTPPLVVDLPAQVVSLPDGQRVALPAASATSLRQRQHRFALMFACLVLHAAQMGYGLALERGTATPAAEAAAGRKPRLHTYKLAHDVSIFGGDRPGEPGELYLETTASHEALGRFWELMGGAWGGHFGDGNHYSLPWRGMR